MDYMDPNVLCPKIADNPLIRPEINIYFIMHMALNMKRRIQYICICTPDPCKYFTLAWSL